MNVVSGALVTLKNAGYKAKAVSACRLPDLQSRVETLQRQRLLNQELVRTCLQFKYSDFPEVSCPKTIFIVSIHQPITRAKFTLNGRIFNADIPPTYLYNPDDSSVEEILRPVIEQAGFSLKKVRLPVKTLAVSSGLAKYGKNNITYIPGFGSFHRLIAFVSDCSCPEDSWVEPELMKACNQCFKCGESCPTRCIDSERFLVHAENCLTWFNEREDQLPVWIQPDWHNSLVGCMRCQLACPVNRKQMNNIVDGPSFSNEETNLLINGTAMADLHESLRSKLVRIAMDDSGLVTARNLKFIIDDA